jgi:ATP-binding cassette subfamily C protein
MIISSVKSLGRVIKLLVNSFKLKRKALFGLGAFGFLSGLLEGVGVNALVPLFSLVVKNTNSELDIVSRYLERFFLYFHFEFRLRTLLEFIFILFVLRAITLLACYYIRIRITATYEEQTRSALLKNMLRASWPYLIKQKLGHLESLLMVDAPYGALALDNIGAALMAATTLLVYLVVAINISAPITLAAMGFGLVSIFIIKPFFKRTTAVGRLAAAANKEVVHFISQNTLGLKTIKTMLVGSSVMQAGQEFFAKLKTYKIKVYMYKNVVGVIAQQLGLLFICVVFIVAYRSPAFNFASFLAVIYLIQRIFTFAQNLLNYFHAIGETVPYLESLQSYLREAQTNEESQGNGTEFKLERALELKNVTFTYAAGNEVLRGVDCSIKRWEFVGLIGPSGAGKTTFVDLLLRLLTPTSGQLLADGVASSEISSDSWRSHIGYVSQDIYLMNDTIANNIRFYDNSLTQEAIESAAKLANIYDFVMNCKEGFNTVVGDRGMLLSAGQRQRIIIARVLARQPKILILDEATSALDNESEVKIQEAINHLKGSLTIIVIAHRLSTIMQADRLLALDKGKIIEEGAPQALLNDPNSYFYKVSHIRDEMLLET